MQKSPPIRSQSGSPARIRAAGLALLLGACAASRAPIAPPVAVAAPAAAPEVVEEPIPAHWIGAFTMVETPQGTAGRAQFQLRLGQQGPNHFLARRGCYLREGWLRRRGDQWAVETRGSVRVDAQCMADPNMFKGFPEGLFEHRVVVMSPPGGPRWIAEGGARWTYLPNPAPSPTPPRAAPPPIAAPPKPVIRATAPPRHPCR